MRNQNAPPLTSAANNHGCRKEAEMNTQNLTILYSRLSRDDGDDSISNSILNQQKLLQEHAERNGMIPFVHVEDDGYTGTNWNRPGWKKIAEEIDAGRVRNLVVKNLDRLGRDYLRVGLLIEQFQEAGLRFIAVGDNIDTADGDDDFTPLRALFAEWYARDCSRKVKAVLHSKGRDGKPLTNKVPYGYVKDEFDINKWHIDPVAAEVVRRIFGMTVNGKGAYEIARILHDDKVERPSYHQAKNRIVVSPSSLEADPYLWRGTTVTGILSRPEYLGSVVNFRSSSVNFKTKKRKKNAPEEWQVFPNAHEAIVSQETWDLAQKLRQTVRRTDTSGEANPLTGLVFCSDCGSKMYNHRGKNTDDSYACSANSLGYQRYTKQCSGHYISTRALRDIVLDILKRTSGYVRSHEDEFIGLVREKTALRQGETAKSHKKRIAKNERRIAEIEKVFRGLYEDKILGRLTPERFDEMSAGYEREQAELKAQAAAMQSELDAYGADGERADKFIELVRRHTRFEELSNAMINEFIDKIIVHESVWSEKNEANGNKGTRTQKVEVFLKYIGAFDVPDMRSAEELEAERIAADKLERNRRSKREYERRRREKLRAAKADADIQDLEMENGQTDVDNIDTTLVTKAAPTKPKPAA